ncbi:MAG: radical SAM protein [Fibrobacter sp.]|nr:radical SAM protein [Fibrobacter sp.]
MRILLSLTEKCNLRCSYCYYKKSQEERCAEMSDEVREAALRFALDKTIEFKQNALALTFFGGEPLLCFDAIRKSVDFLKENVQRRRSELPEDFGVKLAINTNGTLLNKEILEYLDRENIIIYLSLDGPASRHDISRRTVNGKGSFDIIAPFIPELVRQNAFVLSVVTRNNIAGLADSVKWTKDQGFTQIQNMVDFDGHWTVDEMNALAAEYYKLVEFWYEIKKQKSDFYIQSVQDHVLYHVLNLKMKQCSCDILKGTVGIATNGNIFPCSRFITSKPNPPYLLGNVLDKECHVFDGPVAQEVYRFLETDKKECEGCGIIRRCSAHECGCTSFYTTGSLWGVSPEVCTHERILTAICDEFTAKLQKEGEVEDVL